MLNVLAFSRRNRLPCLMKSCIGAVLVLMMASAHAERPFDSASLQIRGFGTGSVVSADGTGLGFRRDTSRHRSVTEGEPRFDTDAMLGLHADVCLGGNLDFAVQAKAKPIKGELDAYIHLAFARLDVNRDTVLRLGRLPHDAYLLSESRDVGVTYLWARPVVEFYGLLLLEHFDGMDFLYRQAVNNGVLEWRAGLGQYDTTVAQADGVSLLSEFDLMWNINVQYVGRQWRWRLGFLQETIDKFTILELDTALEGIAPVIDSLPPEILHSVARVNQDNLLVRQYNAGLAYENGIWSVQTEVAKLQYERAFYTGYISVGRHFERFTPFVVIARNYGRSRDVPASIDRVDEQTLKVAGPLLNTLRGGSDQTALSLGARWDVSKNVALKAQWDRRFTKRRHTYMWVPQQGTLPERRVDTVSLVVDFSF